MQRKTIEEVINRKFDNWVKSITDKKVKESVMKNTIVTGGCITSMFLGEKINDFDFYFTDKETVKLVAEYYVDLFNKNNKFEYEHKAFVIDGAESVEEQVRKKSERMWKTKMLQNVPEDRIKIFIRSDGVVGDKENLNLQEILSEADEVTDYKNTEFITQKSKDEEKNKFRPIFLSTNAITLTDKVQIVVRFYGDADKIHENFDFVHCTNYWRSDTRKLYTNTEALENTLSRTLVYKGSKYPLCSVIRTRKFLKRGWNINAGQYLKMCFQISELDLQDINILEDQLIGVDTAYFQELIRILREDFSEYRNNDISSEYISTLVDKIFG